MTTDSKTESKSKTYTNLMSVFCSLMAVVLL